MCVWLLSISGQSCRRIVVIRYEVQLRKLAIEVRHMFTEPYICSYWTTRTVFADQFCLHIAKRYYVVRSKSVIVQHERGIEPCMRIVAIWRLYLRPRRVLPTPNDIAVCAIEFINAGIPSLKPFAELAIAALTEAKVRLQLVIYLPGYNSSIVRIVHRHTLHDTTHISQHIRMIDTAMTSNAGMDFSAILADHNAIRVFLVQPQWRATGWRTQYHIYAAFRKQRNRSIQPFELKYAVARFQPAPGKLRQTHQLYASSLHQICISSPHFPVPVLGVVIYAY